MKKPNFWWDKISSMKDWAIVVEALLDAQDGNDAPPDEVMNAVQRLMGESDALHYRLADQTRVLEAVCAGQKERERSLRERVGALEDKVGGWKG